MVILSRPLRIALLSYRSKPHCGGQGVYVRHLSRELHALGHHVEVFSGQPYPELDPGPRLRELPSLDLYRDEDPFRTPRWPEYRDWTDVLETVMMWGGSFPEPLTFSLRALRALTARAADFDVVHDNQGLGYGMLGVRRLGLPLVTSIHHPISVDKRIDLAPTGGLSRLSRLSRRRWYGFVRMQARVARRVAGSGALITVSESSKRDICRDFKVPPGQVNIIPLGVDTRVFRPRSGARVPGRIIAVASADSAIKGVGTLLRAVGKLATDRDVHLVIVGKPSPATERLAAQLSLTDRITFTHGLAEEGFSALLASAEIAVVPSLYEGFSFRPASTWRRAPRWWPAAPARCPRSPGTPPCWSRRERTRNSPQCSGGCTTHPPNAPSWRAGRLTGPASASPGPRWPGRRPGSTGP